MKRLMFCATAVFVVVLSGCASDGGSRYAQHKKFVVDEEYVAAVNYLSRQKGVRVTWVNPPVKLAKATDGIEK
jgi:hypothetical protein